MKAKPQPDRRSKIIQICAPHTRHRLRAVDGKMEVVLLLGLGSDGRLWALLPGIANWSEIKTPYNRPAENK